VHQRPRCKQQSEIKMRHIPAVDIFKRYGRGNFFLDQSIGIDETNTFKLKFLILHENCWRHRFGRFVGVKVGVANILGQSIGFDKNNNVRFTQPVSGNSQTPLDTRN